MRDPFVRLAMAIVVQAVRDLKDPDIFKSTDALLWFATGDCMPLFVALDFDFDESDVWARLCDAKFKPNFRA